MADAWPCKMGLTNSQLFREDILSEGRSAGKHICIFKKWAETPKMLVGVIKLPNCRPLTVQWDLCGGRIRNGRKTLTPSSLKRRHMSTKGTQADWGKVTSKQHSCWETTSDSCASCCQAFGCECDLGLGNVGTNTTKRQMCPTNSRDPLHTVFIYWQIQI